MKTRSLARFNHPLTIFALSLLATVFLTLAVTFLFDGDRRTAILTYSVPIAIPFVAYVLDRAQGWPDTCWLVDVPVVLLALSRAFVAVPLVSGHALFLTFAVLTTRMPVARYTALLMLVYVIYLKAFVWQDATLIGGLLLGIGAALAWRKTAPKRVQ